MDKRQFHFRIGSFKIDMDFFKIGFGGNLNE